MKKKKINKIRLKIFIALSLMFTLITTLFIGTKTFAYESDKISYTITQLSDDDFASNIVNIDNNNSYVDINFNSNLYVKGINNFYSNGKQYYLLINFIYLDSNNEPLVQHSSTYTQFNPAIKRENGSYIAANQIRITNNAYNYNGTYYTQIIPFNYNTTYSDFINYARFFYLGGHIRIYNIDMVNSSEIGLSQYYETYYSQIEDNYNQLLDDYENLQDDYSQLSHDYTYLENEYNELENNYNITEQNYLNTTQFYKYSFLAFMQNGYIENNTTMGSYLSVSYTEDNTLKSVDIPITLNQLSQYYNGVSLGIKNITADIIEENEINNVYSADMNIYFQMQVNINYIDFTLHDLSSSQELFLGNDTQTGQTIRLDHTEAENTKIDAEYIEEENPNIKTINFIEFTYIPYDSEMYNPYMDISNTQTATYNNGFSNGYQTAVDNKNNEIQNLNNSINSLNQEINTQQITINSLNEQIASFSSDYNLNNLMWTVASTPFESFKQIWNVQFFGVNVSELLLGLITTFIALSIAKRFFL